MSGVYEDVPLVAIWSLPLPASRSTGAAVEVAVDFAMRVAREGQIMDCELSWCAIVGEPLQITES